jgi:hypothetical protein
MKILLSDHEFVPLYYSKSCPVLQGDTEKILKNRKYGEDIKKGRSPKRASSRGMFPLL